MIENMSHVIVSILYLWRIWWTHIEMGVIKNNVNEFLDFVNTYFMIAKPNGER